MNKEEFMRYQQDKKELIASLDIIPREKQLTGSERLITTVIGPRRAGKTFILYSLMKDAKTEDQLFVNFEDLEVEDSTAKDILDMVEFYQQEYGKEPGSIYFDEIQNVPGWEKAVRELHEKKKIKIFLTGSSSKMLSKEIATQLRGRSLSTRMLPFSFREYLTYKKWSFKKNYSTREENRIKNHLEEYLTHGGFPDVIMEPILSKKFFQEYIDLVMYRDIIERYGIKNIHLLKIFIRSALFSNTKEFSINKQANVFKGQNIEVSKNTLYEYNGHLQDAMFVFPLYRFSHSKRTSRMSIPKVYSVDTGLANALLGYEPGKAMENAVFLEYLRRNDEAPWENIYYFNENGKEVDFVLQDGKKITSLIQVTQYLDASNEDRELGNLIEASEKLKCSDLRLINWDKEGKRKYKGKTIKLVPLWKWLIEDIN